MEHFNLFLVLAVLMGLLWVGCSEIDTTDELTFETLEEVPPEGTMTLEQLNAVMLQYGHEPFKQEDIDATVAKARAYRLKKGKAEKAFYCSSAYPWGDWSKQQYRTTCIYFQNGNTPVLSGLDLALAQSYINAQGGLLALLLVSRGTIIQVVHQIILVLSHTGNWVLVTIP